MLPRALGVGTVCGVIGRGAFWAADGGPAAIMATAEALGLLGRSESCAWSSKQETHAVLESDFPGTPIAITISPAAHDLAN